MVRKQTNGQWLVEAGKSFPADAELMDYWLAGLTNVPTEIVKTVVTDFSPYGLTNPVLHIPSASNRKPARRPRLALNLAPIKQAMSSSAAWEKTPSTPSASKNLNGCRASPGSCATGKFGDFASSNVVSVTVHQLDGKVEYLRDPDGNWTYAPGFNSQVAINSAALEECVFRMGHLRAIYWDAIGDQPQDRFGFAKTSHNVEFQVKHGGTNEIYRIEFGARSPMIHPYASVVRDGQRLIFEFPADLYGDLVEPNLTVFTARYHPR